VYADEAYLFDSRYLHETTLEAERLSLHSNQVRLVVICTIQYIKLDRVTEHICPICLVISRCLHETTVKVGAIVRVY
jgi:hypothetical protein